MYLYLFISATAETVSAFAVVLSMWIVEVTINQSGCDIRNRTHLPFLGRNTNHIGTFRWIRNKHMGIHINIGDAQRIDFKGNLHNWELISDLIFLFHSGGCVTTYTFVSTQLLNI